MYISKKKIITHTINIGSNTIQCDIGFVSLTDKIYRYACSSKSR